MVGGEAGDGAKVGRMSESGEESPCREIVFSWINYKILSS